MSTNNNSGISITKQKTERDSFVSSSLIWEDLDDVEYLYEENDINENIVNSNVYVNSYINDDNRKQGYCLRDVLRMLGEEPTEFIFFK